MNINNNLTNVLNFLRWTAAFFVVSGHLRSFIFLDYQSIDSMNKTIFIKFFYFITGFGHQGVIVFFVISGYLVGGKILNEYIYNKIDVFFIKKYFVNRFTRIYIVLIPAIVLGYIFDTIGHTMFDEKIYLNFYHFSAMNYIPIDRLSYVNIIGNIFNLQGISINTLGSNAPLWSLSNEWWYYIIFILFFINRLTFIFALFIIAMILFFGNGQLLLYSSIWILGAISLLINKNIINVFISIIVLFFVLLFSRIYDGFVVDFLLATSLVLMINGIKYTNLKINYFNKMNLKFADFSYSLYLFHFPFIVLMLSILNYKDLIIIQLTPNVNAFIIFFFMLVFVYLYSFFAYILFESKTSFMKQKIYKILGLC
ncbi:acyltransferase family protein [Sulfurimonas sp.]|uniref:acyltransferase family protein n=1 Tax=Sulfurimonas sp. TaxID=2022749 RepID=UPI0035647EDF